MAKVSQDLNLYDVLIRIRAKNELKIVRKAVNLIDGGGEFDVAAFKIENVRKGNSRFGTYTITYKGRLVLRRNITDVLQYHYESLIFDKQ